jgi:hypothetical protein
MSLMRPGYLSSAIVSSLTTYDLLVRALICCALAWQYFYLVHSLGVQCPEAFRNLDVEEERRLLSTLDNLDTKEVNKIIGKYGP